MDPRDATAKLKTSLGELVPNEDAARVRCSRALKMVGKTFYAGDLAFARVRGRIVLLEIWYHVRCFPNSYVLRFFRRSKEFSQCHPRGVRASAGESAGERPAQNR